MAEETQKPSRNVPNAMTVSMILTYLLGYIVSFVYRPCSLVDVIKSIVLLLLSINPDDGMVIASHSFPVVSAIPCSENMAKRLLRATSLNKLSRELAPSPSAVS